MAVASPDGGADAAGAAARRRSAAAISAFELIAVQGLAFLAEVLPEVPLPPAMAGDWLVLVEVAEAAGAEIGARLEATLGRGARARAGRRRR